MHECFDCGRLTGDEDPNDLCPACLEARDEWAADCDEREFHARQFNDFDATPAPKARHQHAA